VIFISIFSDIKAKFERYFPLVDEIARKQDKAIDISIHLFRNIVDYGIETEDIKVEITKSYSKIKMIHFQ
jgi:hypothetical protein